MRLIANALILFILVLSLTLPAFAADPENAETDYVAIVNGTKIPRQSLEQKLNFVKQRYASQGQQLGEEQLNAIKKDIAQRMVEKELLYQKSRELSIDVDKDKVEDQINEFRKKFDDEEAYQKQLSGMGYTEALLRSEITENMAIQKLIEEEIASKISISDDELKSYYEDNTKQFETPAKVKARHILIKMDSEADETEKQAAKKKIKAAQKRIKSGEAFSQVAEDTSECPSSKKGGDLGFFSKGRMVKGFEEAAFSLEPGEVSDIVETRFGYHLIKVEDKKPADQKSFDEVKADLGEQMKNEKVKEGLDSYMESLKKGAKIQMNLPKAAESDSGSEG